MDGQSTNVDTTAADRSDQAPVDGGLPLSRVALACPLDGDGLQWTGRSCRCASGHAYDLAREGYVNLLPVQFKRSADPGDSREMVQARRNVMDAGLFLPLADALVQTVERVAAPGLLLDAGCGEGYYTHRMATGLAARDQPAGGSVALGIDISKWAVRAAARRYRDVAFAVATNARLPVLAGQVPTITSVFGFETWQAWAGLQRSGDTVLCVQAGADHLLELRQRLYTDVQRHAPPAAPDALVAGYTLAEETPVTYQHTVSGTRLLRGLLAMTPHAHRASVSVDEALAGCDALSITFDMLLRRYRLG